MVLATKNKKKNNIEYSRTVKLQTFVLKRRSHDLNFCLRRFIYYFILCVNEKLFNDSLARLESFWSFNSICLLLLLDVLKAFNFYHTVFLIAFGWNYITVFTSKRIKKIHLITISILTGLTKSSTWRFK